MTKRCIGENNKKAFSATICANWTKHSPIAIKGRWISIIQLSCSSRNTNHCSYPGYHFPLLLSVNSHSFILIIISQIVYTHHILIHRTDTALLFAILLCPDSTLIGADEETFHPNCKHQHQKRLTHLWKKMIELAHPQAINLFFYQDISSHFVNVALNSKLHIGVYLVWVATKGTSQTISLKDIYWPTS